MFWPRGRQMRPIVHPTKCKVKHHCCEYIVPEIHPTHVQNVTHHKYNHVHSFPVTESQVDQITHQHFAAPGPTAVSPFGPGAPTGVSPFGPGAPTGVSPFGPGNPGGPGMVAGAATQPGKCCGSRPRPWF